MNKALDFFTIYAIVIKKLKGSLEDRKLGYYIQTPGQTHNKALSIAMNYDGEFIHKPNKFTDIPEGKALIVVVDNGAFEAAALAYSEQEFEEFTNSTDTRHKDYVLLDKPTAYRLARYPD